MTYGDVIGAQRSDLEILHQKKGKGCLGQEDGVFLVGIIKKGAAETPGLLPTTKQSAWVVMGALQWALTVRHSPTNAPTNVSHLYKPLYRPLYSVEFDLSVSLHKRDFLVLIYSSAVLSHFIKPVVCAFIRPF